MRCMIRNDNFSAGSSTDYDLSNQQIRWQRHDVQHKLIRFNLVQFLLWCRKTVVYSNGRDPHTSVQSSRVAREGLLPPRITLDTLSDLLSPQIHERVRVLETMGPQSNITTVHEQFIISKKSTHIIMSR